MIKSLVGVITLIAGINISAYTIATPGPQIILSIVGGSCLGIFAALAIEN